MKKIKFIYLTIAALSFAACSKDLVEPVPNDAKQETTFGKLKISGDGVYDLLGNGYDATGRSYHSSSGRAPVIDLVAFKVANSSRIIENLATSSYQELVAGTNAKEFTSTITTNANASGILSLFTGEVKSTISKTSKVSSNESYARFNLMIQKRQVTLNAPNELLIKYLSNDFKNDLLTESPQSIIYTYGTHVLSDVILGARLRVTYKANTSYSNKVSAVTAGVSASVLKMFTVALAATYDHSLTTTNSNELVNFETIGGNPSNPLQGGTIDPNKATIIDIRPWQTSVDQSNICLIDVRPGSMIPISEFVSDPIKKIELQNAISAYISHSGIEQVSELYRYYNPGTGDHFYTSYWTDFAGGHSGWNYENITGYVLPASSTDINAVPLYRYYNPNLQKNFYTTNYSELGSGRNDWILEEIACKVYKTQMPNTVPLYRYINPKLNSAHFYTTDFREIHGGQDGWIYEKIECYVLYTL